MNRRIKHAVDRWLRMEREGRSERADRALQKVFSLMPVEPIPEGFTDRLLARTGLAPLPAPGHTWTPAWGQRAVVSLCLTLVALSFLIIPSYLPSLLGIFNLGQATELGVEAVVALCQQLGVGLVIWRALSAAGSILTSALSSPPSLALLFLSLLVSLGALRILHEFILTERSSRYVGSA